MPTLSIDITPEEYQKLEAIAALKGQTIKDFVLNRTLGEAPAVDDMSESEPHCCKNFTLRSPLRERIPAYREGSACCHGCGIRDYPIAPAVRSGNVAQNALRACYAGTRRAFVKFFMQHWGEALEAMANFLKPRIEQARRGELSTKTFEDIRREAQARAGL